MDNIYNIHVHLYKYYNISKKKKKDVKFKSQRAVDVFVYQTFAGHLKFLSFYCLSYIIIVIFFKFFCKTGSYMLGKNIRFPNLILYIC